jgi:ABC-type bacteriocin/lantibiotic exporter with double-glycine peptidase domain
MKTFFENIKETFQNYRKGITIVLLCILGEQIVAVLTPYLTGGIVDILSVGGDDAFNSVLVLITGILVLRVISRFIFWQREVAEINYYSFDLGRDNYMKGLRHHFGLSGG